jgi:hypothetical protein
MSPFPYPGPARSEMRQSHPLFAGTYQARKAGTLMSINSDHDPPPALGQRLSINFSFSTETLPRLRLVFPPCHATPDKRVVFGAGTIEISPHFSPRIDVGKRVVRQVSNEGFGRRVCGLQEQRKFAKRLRLGSPDLCSWLAMLSTLLMIWRSQAAFDSR